MDSSSSNKYEPSSKIEMPQNLEEKIATAKKFKEEGNAFVKSGLYKKAIVSYMKVFAYLNGVNATLGSILSGNSSSNGNNSLSGVGNSSATKEMKILLDSVHSNISLCYLKIGKPKKSLEHINVVLSTDPNNIKAIFRRGQSYLELQDLDLAESDLNTALKAFPNDSLIQGEVERLYALRKKFEREEQKRMKSIFDQF